MLIRAAEIAGRCLDLRCSAGRIREIAPGLSPHVGEEILEARGGALLPGLHDHHIHLNALAAALSSVTCGPPEVADAKALARALANEPDARGWLRGTGYFESVAGPLDRVVLDRFRRDIPVRVQHRSGAMWFLNSRALEVLGVDDLTRENDPEQDRVASLEEGPNDRPERAHDVPMLERDSRGRATGRLFRGDTWLRSRLPNTGAPDLARVGRTLAGFGVTAMTDATPTNGPAEADVFRAAQSVGALPQRLAMMGTLDAANFTAAGIDADSDARTADSTLGIDAHKIMLDEPALPDLDRLIQRIRGAHERQRPVAIHTVTRVEIHFALAALESAGCLAGDRLEHASIAPPEVIETVRRLDLVIVTQPNFLAERGDAYRTEVDPRDRPHLYLVKRWLDAGVRLGGGTDAPFGHPDPWRAMRAAVLRCTATGHILGPEECVSPETALRLFLPGFSRAPAPPRETAPAVGIGDPADLCLLTLPWSQARRDLSSDHVRATLIGGALIFSG